MPQPERPSFPDLTELALSKMERILGKKRGRELLDVGLAELKLAGLLTPTDLLRFSAFLKQFKGFESAVGALLGVQAAIYGAKREE